MTNITTNYKFNKPKVEDFINIEDLNENFDKIDLQMKDIENKVIYQLGEVVKKTKADITYYVSPSGSDTTGDGTQSKPFATIQHCIGILPIVINHIITIQLSQGYYSNPFAISNFIGGGGIIIKGDMTSLTTAQNYTINATRDILNNSARIYLWGITFNATSNAENTVYLGSNQSVFINTCVFNGNNGGAFNRAIYCNNTKLDVYNCSISNYRGSSAGIAVCGVYNSQIFLDTISGSNNQFGIYTNNSSKVGANAISMTSDIPRRSGGGAEITGSTETDTILFNPGANFSQVGVVPMGSMVNGNIVNIVGSIVPYSDSTTGQVNIVTATSYKPSKWVFGACLVQNKTNGAFVGNVMASMDTDGRIFVHASNVSATNQYIFSFSYITN